MTLPTHSSGTLDTARLDPARRVLAQAVEHHAFPGASLTISLRGERGTLCAGRFTYEADSKPVTPNTIYDLASLTKVVATTSIAMVLHERGVLQLESPIAGICPEFLTGDPRRSLVTFATLLTHSSGLPAHERLYLRCRTQAEMLAAAMHIQLLHDPGQAVEYSDIGFIVLGEALQRLAGQNLDVVCHRELLLPLAMKDTFFRPLPETHFRIPPTQDEEWRGRALKGEVNDGNAFALGGVAGHAGLFGTADDLITYAECLLGRGPAIFKPETVARFTSRQPSPPNTTRALGWDTPSPSSQAGKHFGPRSFGHLGYTGTSLWIDPDRQLSIAMLTNRTWPNDSSQLIKQVRPALHDAIVDALD